VSKGCLAGVSRMSVECLKGVWRVSMECSNSMSGVKMYVKGKSGVVNIG